MATNINISVHGHDLVERSKQQQRDARTKRLTTASLTEEAEKNRNRILREVPTADTAAQLRAIDTDTAPFIRSNRPSASRMPDTAFLLVTVQNLDATTTFQSYTVRLTDPNGVTYTLVGKPYANGFLNRDRTFLFLPRNRTVYDFERSTPYKYIYQTLLDSYSGGPIDPDTGEPVNYGVEFVEPVFTLYPFKPERSVPYLLDLSFPEPGLLSAGVFMAGYLRLPTYYMDLWLGSSPIISPDVIWGTTNQSILDFYPSDYPR